MKTASFILLIIGLSALSYAASTATASAGELPECTAVHILSADELQECKITITSQLKERSKEYNLLQEKQDLLKSGNDIDRLRMRVINRRLSDFQLAQ